MPNRFSGDPRFDRWRSDVQPRLEGLRDDARTYAGEQRDRVRERLADRSTRPVTLFLLTVAAGILAVFLAAVVFTITLPGIGDIRNMEIAEASIAYSADGKELTRYHIENRTWVPLEEISPNVRNALIATEDARFYYHFGVDIPGTISALANTAAGDGRGGSTITMQLARNVFPQLKKDHVLVRKMKEWMIALRLEDEYTKDQILEMYLNVVPFMYETAGIEAAARTYFVKPAKDLEVDEAATLIGLLKATAYYNPVRHPERSHQRRNTVLSQMVKYDYLDRAEYERLQDQPTELRFRRITRQDNEAPFFAEYIRQWLDEWAEKKGYNLYTDGLRVYTTVDSRLQQAAESAVKTTGDEMQAVVDVEWSNPSPFFSGEAAPYLVQQEKVKPFAHFWAQNQPFLNDLLRAHPKYKDLTAQGMNEESALAELRADSVLVDTVKLAQQRLEAGFLAIDPKNGHIRAWVGGRNFEDREFDHVVQAKRQPGSTFKPFVYAAALENGFAPYSALTDAVFTWRNPETGEVWSPRNFGDASGRLMTLGQGLAHSKNTITAKLITTIGADKVVDVAHRMGIRSPLTPVPSLGLGTSEVNLFELTAAYATLANQGIYREPILITRIEDRDGNVIARFGARKRRGLPAHTAHAVLDMLRGTVQFGTAVRFRYMFGAKGDLAGKTGTTQNAADGWFMLMHPDLVVGSWMGFYSPKVTFRTTYWGQGAHNALHMVGRFYQEAREMDPLLLDQEAKFAPAPEHEWTTRHVSETENLNTQERQSNKLQDVLDRIRARKSRSGDEAGTAESTQL